MHDEAGNPTWEDQRALEVKVQALYKDLFELSTPEEREAVLVLLRDKHARYLKGGLGKLPAGFAALDASRPWLCYWIVHGLALLGKPLVQVDTEEGLPSASDVVSFLQCCQDPGGGYGGSPKQRAHLAPTYAAVNALVTLGGEAALESIDRDAIASFLRRVAVSPSRGGGFVMHEGKAICQDKPARQPSLPMGACHLLPTWWQLHAVGTLTRGV